MVPGIAAIRVVDLSISCRPGHLRKIIFMVIPLFMLILSTPSFVYGQKESLAPFSSMDDRFLIDVSGNGNFTSLGDKSPLQEERTSFKPVFQGTSLNSDSSSMSSVASGQNETQKQMTPLSSVAQHPREPLTQYQTVVQTPARTLTVQPTGTLPPATVYPPGITVPSTAGIGGTSVFPQTTLAGTGTLPPSAVTFPPSVFPPTTSYVPPTSIAPVVGPLSPWFPSIPAIACGGTFSFSVVGSLDRDNDNGNDDNNDKNNNAKRNDNNDNDKDKLYAIQIQSNGGSALDTDSIEGKVFAGEKNIERNNGEDFDIKDVFNDCQVVTFSN